ncbi:MAG: DNA polymerase IV [Bacillota bacterium]
MRKVIFLVDMNAFFISCEMARNPALKGKPAAVAGDPDRRSGIILAANYEARKYKIKTTMLLHEAKKLCPELIIVPPDGRLYSANSREVMNILKRYTPVIQQNSIDEAWMDLTGCEQLFGKPVEIAQNIMSTIIRELDLWCSIGISENKFLAKMASELKKPLGITELWMEDIPQKLWPLGVREMYGIGKQTEKKLQQLAIYTIGELARSKKETLANAFGRYGEELHRLANGIDDSTVDENPLRSNKSISRSTTLPQDITDLEYAKNILLQLAEEVGMEARKDGNKGKTVSIVIRYGDFNTITRQKTITPTYLTKEIFEAGTTLLEQNWNMHRPIRLLGIGISGFSEEYSEQLSIFDLPTVEENDKRDKKEEKLERAMDAIREKYGLDKVKRARTLNDE